MSDPTEQDFTAQRDIQVQVNHDGKVAIRWHDDDWFVVTPLRGTPSVQGPHTRAGLGGGWITRPYMPWLGRAARELLRLCAAARRDGLPDTRDDVQLIIAFILNDQAALRARGRTEADVEQKLMEQHGWAPDDPRDLAAWVTAMRVELDYPGFVTGLTEATW